MNCEERDVTLRDQVPLVTWMDKVVIYFGRVRVESLIYGMWTEGGFWR